MTILTIPALLSFIVAITDHIACIIPTVAEDTVIFFLCFLFFAPHFNGSAHVVSGDEDGPFRFDCNALEVKLSPRSREREADNTAADATFEALATEVRVFLSTSFHCQH